MLHLILELISSWYTLNGDIVNYFCPSHLLKFTHISLLFGILPFIRYELYCLSACLPVCLSALHAWVIRHMWTITNFICGDLLSECVCHRGRQHQAFWITFYFFFFNVALHLFYFEINRFHQLVRMANENIHPPPKKNNIYIYMCVFLK